MAKVGLEWDADPFRTHVERRADAELLLQPQAACLSTRHG